jgi:signal transduction histidine kinase
VRGRRGRLAQALDNVIANALEHGRGDVVVEGELVGNRIQISVSDQGHGVSARSRLRAASPRSRRGHGIAIIRTTVTDHGGRLLFEQREGGFAVVIELPVAEGGAPVPARSKKPLPVPARSGAQRAA